MKRKSVRFFLASLLTLSTLLAACGGSGVQEGQAGQQKNASAATEQKASEQEKKIDYPTKPIKMIVPFAPGGNTDIAARIIAEAANKYLPNGQSIVVENKPGGGGTIGVTELVQSKPDGYTISTITGGAVIIQPHFGKTAYTYTDIEPIMRIVSMSNVIAVKADAPWKTFEEWLDYVKQNPGKFVFSTAGTGLSGHIAMEALNQAAGVKTKHVPFDGASPAITALLGGHVNGAILGAIEAKPYVDSGELRVLAQTGTVQSEAFKDVPFLKDMGVDVEIDVWTGIIAPKDLPVEIRDILHDVFKKAIEDPEVIEAYKKAGIDTSYASPDDFKKQIEEDFKKHGEILKAAGLIQN